MTKTKVSDGDSRGKWGSWLEFFFSMVGCLVGLSNIWRFPYICYHSGGAAFLIPYFIAMFVCGMPALFLETAYCQFSSLGPGRVWIICPLFKGIGFGMVTLTAVVSIYYNVILAWTVFYLISSFRAVLPWSTCDNDWNTHACQTFASQSNISFHHNESWKNTTSEMDVTSYANDQFNSTSEGGEYRLNMTSNHFHAVTSAEEFWRLHVLDVSPGVGEPGHVRWQLALCLLGAWLVVFLSLIKGIKSSGKVVYVAATLPYVILIALLIRGLTLPGAIDGIRFYSIPKWEKLLDPNVWRNAAAQVFFSAGIGWGGVSTLASYNKFHNNCYRDAILLPVLDCVTSWFAGLIIFVFLGYMANQANVPIDDVIKEGPGLAFMAYPDAVSTMPLPQLWSVLFFLMLFTVGLDSQFVHVQTIACALTDTFPRSLGHRKALLTGSICLVGFLLGLSCVTQGGIYVLTLMDWYISSVSVMALVSMELLVLAWIYGVNRLYADIEMMIGYSLPGFWKPLWLVVAPLFVIVLLLAGLVNFTPVSFNGRGYPGWASIFGWFIAIAPLIPIPLCMGVTLWREDGETLTQKLKSSIRPRNSWKASIDDIDEDADVSTEMMKPLDGMGNIRSDL